jgi:transketolase
VDGHDAEAVNAAIVRAKAERQRPTLICCKTVIAKGAPKKANTGAAHGAPLGAEEIAATRASLGWEYPAFEIPRHIRSRWNARERGARLEAEWNERLARYEKAHPKEAAELQRRLSGALPAAWHEHGAAALEEVNAKAEKIATRKASQNAIEALAPVLPELIGGSADLTGSNLTMWSGSRAIERHGGGNYIYFGVREFAMSAISTGIALHGGLIPYCATFLTFSDYARNALRMAALMKQRVLFVFTHDSIGLGEDGPTHQPIEHASSLRLIPNMDVWRPCDAAESLVAWMAALERRDGPSSLLFTRQNVAFQPRTAEQLQAIRRGGYILSEASAVAPKAVIIATGSEVELAVSAQKLLASEQIPVRVVSMPSTTIFDRQPAEYRKSLLPPGIPKIAVEAGVSDLWRKYVGLEGAVVGIDRFGESAPAADAFRFFGFTADRIAEAVRQIV